MKTSNYIISLLIVFSLGGCRKDKLKGEREELIGKWKWVKTVYKPSLSSPFETYSTPSSIGTNYKIEFRKCGKFYYYMNNECALKSRTDFNSSPNCSNTNGSCSHALYLLDDGNNSLGCELFPNDCLVISRFPYYDFNDNDGYLSYYYNVYLRE